VVSDPRALFDLTDRVALVTGGSRGLGRAIVLAFASAGADVVISSRKLDACEALAEEVKATTGRRALPYACHVGHWDELEPLVDAAYDEFGQLDVLVNNAGMSPLYETVLDINEKLYDSVLGVNLKGPFRLTALAATRMAQAHGGSVINISSVAAVRPGERYIVYSAAKAGLNALTVAFAHTFGPKVRVNAIMPGTFMTDISKAWDENTFKQRMESFAIPRGAEPDEIVGAALYLASDASTYTTGAVLRVDGGQP
jgi:NAD(P)-dependent dehydrogenase (short-subunit alcohol dehydrogenase family)